MLGELNHKFEGINDFICVTHDLAESLSEIILDREVVEGSKSITNPVVNSEEEVVSVVEGLLEVNWEHGRESFLSETDKENNKSNKLSDHLGESGVGALEFSVRLGHLWGQVSVTWFFVTGGHCKIF